MRTIETVLLQLESSPWAVVYRALIGFVTLAAFAHLRREPDSAWGLVVWILAALAALRIGTAVARKVLPFSDVTQRTWAQRRGLTKLYDSYQWRKLRGIGLGLALYMIVTRQFPRPWVVVAIACIVVGFIASVRWSRLHRSLA